MAAMAPALTDAPAEAHHIRFKLAAPSSSLSPASAENNGNASNILIHSGSPTKCKAAPEDCSLDFCGGDQEQQQQQPQADPVAQASALGKLQPLVASYLCSDVTPVPSTKDSIKLQGVLLKQSVLKGHRILPTSLLNGGGDFLLRKRQQIELSGSQLKSLMSGTNGGGQPAAPVNGLAKKLATMSGSDCVMSVNGVKPCATGDPQSPNLSADFETLTATLSGHTPVKGTLKQKHSVGSSQNTDGKPVEPSALHSAALSPLTHGNPYHHEQMNLEEAKTQAPMGQAQGSDGERPSGSLQESPSCTHALPTSLLCSSSSLDSLDAHVRERTLLNSSRQVEIESRLRRLRKRLQVVQAKQVERHIQQQLGGFLDSALNQLLIGNRKAETTTPAAAWRTGRHSSSHGRDGLSRFLKNGSMPLELERLYLSGSANLHSAESAFDSDVTESSSGGDSDLEEEELARVDIEQRHVKIWKRAESRYTVERAAIISHWNWLQAHISDLEYRIRQQTDIYRQIRASKGLVELGGLAPNAAPSSGAEVKLEPLGSQDVGAERLENSGNANAEGGPWRGQNGQPVNGVLSRMTESADIKHQQPLAYDGTCVAARTRPLVGCRRRRVIQPNAVPNLNGKAPRSNCVQCNCRVNPSCVMCGGGWPTAREDPQYELPNLERLSRLDLGVHPILSFPDDVCIGLRLQQVMKSQWQTKSLERSKPLKKLSLKHKLSSSKEKHKFTNSLMAVRLGHYKNRGDKARAVDGSVSGGGAGGSSGGSSGGSAALNAARLDGRAVCKTERLQALSSAFGHYDKGFGRKRPREQPLDRAETSPKLFLESSGSCPTLANMHPFLHSPLTRQLSTSSDNSMPLGPGSQSIPNTPQQQQQQPIKRRRGESSFDINNIVIPMSVAATTRVEKLQYKEILTPSWRSVDIFSQPITEEENDREVEDLTDAAFTVLHQAYEDQERTRWTWMALAPAKRRGSRSYKSVDGRTTPLLCGTNPPTPQPASPDPGHCPMLHDYSHVLSPMSPASPDTTSNPHTPCSRDSHRLLSSEDTRCSTPDFNFEERTEAPWERRSFPLPEDPALEPEEEEEESDHHARPRMRSLSGCRVTAYGRIDLDDMEQPCDDDGSPIHKVSAHR